MRDYEIDIEKACPRCGSKKVVVRVVQGWTFQSHLPMCACCGLGYNETKIATSEITAKAVIANFYYEYEPKGIINS